MKAIELLEKLRFFPRLFRLFPEFVETAREVTVIPWCKEFGVSHSSLVDSFDGVALMDTKEISFKSRNPSAALIIHEIGHIHYGESDHIWSKFYVGGEYLMQMALWKKYTTNDVAIRQYHEMMHGAFERPQSTASLIARRVMEKVKVDCYPHLFPLMLYTGIYPNDLLLFRDRCKELCKDLCDPRWGKVRVSTMDIHSFMDQLFEGVLMKDPLYTAYATSLGFIWNCPDCNKLVCKCGRMVRRRV